MKFSTKTLLVTVAMLFVLNFIAHGFAETDRVIGRDAKLHVSHAEYKAWPKGVLALLNDPSRTNGWAPFFSELSNDVEQFEFSLETPRDTKRIVSYLSRIDCEDIVIRLSPDDSVSWVGHGQKSKSKNSAALFSIGSQPTIDTWYSHLPEEESGIRKFGVHRYTAPPKAMVPTLTLHVGHPNVDLNALKIPGHVTVEDYVPATIRETIPIKPAVAEIDAYLKRRFEESATQK